MGNRQSEGDCVPKNNSNNAIEENNKNDFELSKIPVEVLLHIFTFILPGRGCYATLHLVCRQWHEVLSAHADYLPKWPPAAPTDRQPLLTVRLQSENKWRIGASKLVLVLVRNDSGNTANSGTAGSRLKQTVENRNDNNGGDRVVRSIKLSKIERDKSSLFALLRHIDYKPCLTFGDKIVCTDACLNWLSKTTKRFGKFHLTDWDMSRVSPEAMATYIGKVAKNLEVVSFYGMVNASANLISDKTLEPLVTSGHLLALDVSSRRTSKNGYPLVTGVTLRNFAENLPLGRRFALRFRKTNITAKDVVEFIRSYQESERAVIDFLNNRSHDHLIVDSVLMDDIRSLLPEDSYRIYNGEFGTKTQLIFANPSRNENENGTVENNELVLTA